MPSIKFLLLLSVLLAVVSARVYDFYRTLPVYHDGEHVKVSAVVKEEPKLTQGKQRVKVKTKDGVSVTVVTGPAPLYEYGDNLLLDGVFTQQEYKGYTYWVSYYPKVQTVHNEQNIVTGSAYTIRNEAKKLFESTLPPTSSSLILGIVLGGKHGMPEGFLENLRVTGVMHVIAASGMNISFVAAFLVAALGTVFSRRLTLFTAVLGIGFYVILAGFEPSIVRAAVMSSLAFGAAFLGRQSAAVWTLCITGYVMLFVSPSLIEDIGFQLSFLSTLGILTIKPLFVIKAKKHRFRQVWEEDVTTTIAAQLAALPVLLGVFGNYGLLSIIANALILWTVPILMALGSLAIALSIVFEPLGKLVLYLAYPFLWFFEAMVTWFGSIGWVLETPEMPMSVWVGYYLVLAAVVVGNRKKLKERREELLVREM